MTDYISIDISVQFPMTLTFADIRTLVNRIYNEGIGDWCVLEDKHENSLPLQLMDIATNCTYSVGLRELEFAICTSLLDFPYALDVQNGFNLRVDKLTNEDIDEIVQLAVFGSMQYSWTW